MGSRTEVAFAAFMRGRWPALVRLGYGLTGDARLAEDLARSALARVYASWPRVLRAGDPNVYLCRAMLSASRGTVRRRRARETGAGAAPDPAAAAEASAGRPALLTALLRLPERQRWVLLLRYWMGMTEPDVAAALECSAGSVRSQASQALAALRAGGDVAEEMPS
jgi:RNA polymerase sigma-70 factor (sigma-E family)